MYVSVACSGAISSVFPSPELSERREREREREKRESPWRAKTEVLEGLVLVLSVVRI